MNIASSEALKCVSIDIQLTSKIKMPKLVNCRETEIYINLHIISGLV
jgi:hypothetical protein